MSKDTAEEKGIRPFDKLRQVKMRDIVAAIVGVLSFSLVENIGTAFEVWDKAQLAFGLRPDALAIAKAGERERGTRDLLQLAQRRAMEIRYFIDLAVAGRPQPELDEAWRAYHSARMAWDERAVVNALAIERWYGPEKRKTLENDIDLLFAQTHWCMLDLRFNGIRPLTNAPALCRGNINDSTPNFAFLRILSNTVQRQLYCFAAGMDAELPKSLPASPSAGCRTS
jgi:hypothetical protein